jgi:hypothetical protein
MLSNPERELLKVIVSVLKRLLIIHHGPQSPEFSDAAKALDQAVARVNDEDR